MRAFLGVAGTGLSAVLLSPLRSFVAAACLVAVLLPYLVGLALSRGVEQEAEESIRSGSDLYVAAQQFGRDAPVPLSIIPTLQRIEGVNAVTPRIVGTIGLGGQERAVLVGLPPEHFPEIACVEGRLPAASALNELVIGTELAKHLNLHVGDLLPPFYQNRRGEKLSEIVGVFRSDLSFQQSRLVFTTFDSAAAIFDQPGLATDLLVACRRGYQDNVQESINRLRLPGKEDAPSPRLRAVSREDLTALIPRGLAHREGIFSSLFVLAFAVGILVMTVASGLGLAGRRREVGILKATGWQTDELLLRAMVESLAIVVAGFSAAVVLAYIWLNWCNGFWVASIFFSGVGVSPSFRVPYQLAPVPALLALVVSFVVVMTGTLYSTWRAAVAPPVEVMR